MCAPVDEDDSDVSKVQAHDLWCGGPGHDDTELSKEFGMLYLRQGGGGVGGENICGKQRLQSGKHMSGM
jgi:hypothetical protein